MHKTDQATQAWERVALVTTLLVAAGLRLWRLSQNEFGNSYYAAAVRSMLASWHNFFFVSFDPAGFVSVDKPPVALWLQAASAKLFGYHGLSLLVPQALAGIASCWLLYRIVRKASGPTAGLLAALVLALTPINVATDRSNNMDSALVLVLLAATASIVQSLQDGKLGSLLLGAILLGIAFNVKMMAAFVVLPTFALVYGLSSPLPWKQRLGHLTAATALLIFVSISWAATVDLTPKSERPYVGSSSNNSALGLIIDYNGIGRLAGGQMPGGNGRSPFPGGGGPGGGFPQMPQGMMPPGGGFPPMTQGTTAPGGGFPPMPQGAMAGGGFPPVASGGMPGGFPMPPGGGMPGGGPMGRGSGGPMGMMFGGTPGPLRLAQTGLADQVMWLLPLALLGMFAALTRWRRRFPLSARGQQFLLWGGWLGTYGVVYSFARGIVHPYYLVTLAPALGALTGMTLTLLWDEYRRGDWRGYLLPASLLLTALWEANILKDYPDQARVLRPLLLACTLTAVILLIVATLPTTRLETWRKVGMSALAVGLIALLLSPTAWALTCVLSRGNSLIPIAGPQLQAQNGFGPMMGPEAQDSDGLITFLNKNHHGERYLLMTGDFQTAASIIIKTGETAIAMGGFSGSDPILTPARLSRLVQDRQVRFILLGGMAMMRDHDTGVTAWVRQHGKPVATNLWRSAKSEDAFPFPTGNMPPAFLKQLQRMGGPMGRRELYDCAPNSAMAANQP